MEIIRAVSVPNQLRVGVGTEGKHAAHEGEQLHFFLLLDSQYRLRQWRHALARRGNRRGAWGHIPWLIPYGDGARTPVFIGGAWGRIPFVIESTAPATR